MTPAKLAETIAKYRNAATLAIAGAVALVMTLGTQRGYFRLRLGSSLRYFVFVFFVVGVLVAIAFTVVLVIAETKAEAKAREPDDGLPKATARPRSVTAKPSEPSCEPASVSTDVGAPRAEPSKQPDRAPGDGPTFLR
jgi:hypothetical protein